MKRSSQSKRSSGIRISSVLLGAGLLVLLIGAVMTFAGIPLNIVEAGVGGAYIRTEGLTSGQATIITIGVIFLGSGYLLKKQGF